MVCLALALVLGNAPVPTDAPQALGFAEALLAEGDHYRAIGEYKRYLYLDPAGPSADAARFGIGLCYLRGAQPEAAERHYARLLRVYPHESPLAAHASLQQGYARYLASDALGALVHLRQWEAAFPQQSTSSDRARARYLIGWAHLQLLEHEAASAALSSVPEFDGQSDLVASAQGLSLLPRRSPWLAALLSIVPGGGHLYLGQPGIAAGAFAWNAVFGYALYDSIARGQVGVAVVLGLFEALWYFGAMFGAVNGAHRFNRDVRRNALDELRSRFDDRPESWPPSPPLPRPP